MGTQGLLTLVMWLECLDPNMKKIYLFIAIFTLSLNVFSQERLWYEKNISSHKNYFENKYGITYTIPSTVKELDKFYVMWKVRNDPAKHSGYMYGPIFLSKDKDCIIAYPAQPHFVSEQEEERRGIIKSNFPRGQIAGEIKTALGLYYHYGSSLNNDTAKFDFNNYVTIIAGHRPRELFNADSIFIYDLPSADSVCFFDESLEKMRKEKYPYCTGIFICKNGRATMDIKFFFTQKGKKKQNRYIEILGKHIWYDDKFHYQ